ncbi:MAG: adenylyltransferase [Thermoleophilaceae bacterium]|jgi:ATP adenylyltransferase|nr:adenylyltransferase [Thermoleophilaceae bacterium]
MDHLWAPWRGDYIKEPKSGECIFCTMPEAGDDEASLIVWRGTHCYVMLNAYPYNNGHLMVSPYAHIDSIEDFDQAAAGELMALTRRGVAALRVVYDPGGFNIGANQGKEAGAGFGDHFHMHVVPRWGGDTNFMPVIASTRVLPESLSQSYAAIRAEFERQEA